MLLLLIPIISAFIGWVTNWIAIKMLFHPRQKKKILFFTLQGIFPKRQQQFAEKLGKLVAEELFSFEDIEQKMTNPQKLQQLKPMLEEHIDHFLKVKLPAAMPVLGMFISDTTISKIKNIFIEELDILFPAMLEQYLSSLRNELDLEKIIVQKVSEFSSDKLEEILHGIMSKEFRFIEIIGAVLGFIIGLLQVSITFFAR
jgi:uncharacterized membrane protein YheB (UPF0754 family)